MAAMMQKKATFASRSMSAVSPSTRNLVVARYSQSLTASDLAAFKIVDLVEIAGKKGVSGGRNATRETLTNAILRAGVSVKDLTKGQLADLKAKNPSVGSGSSSSSYSAPAGGRFSNYSNGSSSSRAAPRASSGATLSAGDLSAFKIVDLVEIAGKKGVSAGRNATRDSLTSGLVQAGVTLNDLTRGQLVDLGIKLGEAGLPRDINAARAKLAALIGGSGSAPASWRSTPTPAASTDRFANYSRSSPAASSGGRGSTGAKLSASDLSTLRIDDLRDLVKKTGAELPREPTKEGVISALVGKGVSLDDCTRGMLVDLATKLGAPLARDVAGLKANLASRVGGGSSSGSSSSWRSSSAPASTPAPAAAAGGDRWAKYSAGSTKAASWRRSGSHNASGSKLSASDLSTLSTVDLRDLVKKTGAELPREPTKEGVISSLLGKGVSLNDLTRGMLVDLANKLGVSMARDVDSLRKNLESAVGKGSYSQAAPSSSSSSSWRTPAAPASSSNGSTDRWANYSRGSSNGSRASSADGSQAVFEADLQGFKIDMLSEMARKKGISMRNATKDSLVSQLSKTLTLADLSRGQLIEILSNIGQSVSGSVEDLRSRVAAAASQRQTARGRSLSSSRW